MASASVDAFTAQHGFQADGHYGAKSWLWAVTKVTRGATGWARRLQEHPVLAATRRWCGPTWLRRQAVSA